MPSGITHPAVLAETAALQWLNAWARRVEQRAAVEQGLRDGLRLSKIRKLLIRKGVAIPYPTLHRFAVLELRFGQTAATIPVADGEPGHRSLERSRNV